MHSLTSLYRDLLYELSTVNRKFLKFTVKFTTRFKQVYRQGENSNSHELSLGNFGSILMELSFFGEKMFQILSFNQKR